MGGRGRERRGGRGRLSATGPVVRVAKARENSSKSIRPSPLPSIRCTRTSHTQKHKHVAHHEPKKNTKHHVYTHARRETAALCGQHGLICD